MQPHSGAITALIEKSNAGDTKAANELFEQIYSTLRSIAIGYMSRERPGHILQATAVVNEAYVRLFGGGEVKVSDRAEFYRLAACVMRRVLIDHARAAHAGKREGQAVALQEWMSVLEPPIHERLDMESALKRLGELDPRQEEIMSLVIYAGRTAAEIAEQLGVTVRTVQREINSARVFLRYQLLGGRDDDARAVAGH